MKRCFIGDCREVMRDLISQRIKVQMCVTSPPYWGLRDYGVAGQLGLEKTPEEYVATMVEVFSLVRELLQDDGTLWLNLGDSYAGSWGDYVAPLTIKHKNQSGTRWNRPGYEKGKYHSKPPTANLNGLKKKDLVGIPWRVAFALQADGWYLRSDIIWHKPNPMPESVNDRPTKSHEYIFLLSKNKKYYYDAAAISEPCKVGYNGSRFDDERDLHLRPNTQRGHRKYDGTGSGSDGSKIRDHHGESMNKENNKRNKRSVWTVNTTPYKKAHFATFPSKLIEPCILAGSRTGDIVFDPFFGSGTTGEVASKFGRQWIGIELNPEYEKLQEERTADVGLALY